MPDRAGETPSGEKRGETDTQSVGACVLRVAWRKVPRLPDYPKVAEAGERPDCVALETMRLTLRAG